MGHADQSAALGAGDVHICVPHERTMALHCLCDGIDSLLFGAPKT